MIAMTPLYATLFAIICLMVFTVARGEEGEGVAKAEDVPMTITFVNQFPEMSIELYWENPISKERQTEGTISPRGGSLDVSTFVGHEFSYDIDGQHHYVKLPPSSTEDEVQFAILAGESDGFLVRCDLQQKTETTSELETTSLNLLVKPYWAPRGAARFLELVREKYYDGVVLNRVVPKFLVQFGIAKDHEQKIEWDENTIFDDSPDVPRPFGVGYVSFAGNGDDSRTTEIFIAMPGASQEQLDYFGENSWETPFAVLQGDANVLSKIYSDYGDMPPWGKGPDSDRIYDEDGYEYLAQNFPNIDYIDRCYIIDEVESIAEEL